MRDSYKQENADLKKLVQIKSKKHRDQFTLSVKLAEARTIVAERDKKKAERIRGAIERDQHKLQKLQGLMRTWCSERGRQKGASWLRKAGLARLHVCISFGTAYCSLRFAGLAQCSGPPRWSWI